MNARRVTQTVEDQQLLQLALTGMKSSTGFTGELESNPDTGDLRVVLTVAGARLPYRGEIKRTVDRAATLEDMRVRARAGEKTLLVTYQLTSAMAERCQEVGIEFIDTAGNAFITNGAGILISVQGRKAVDNDHAKAEKSITPAVLRIMFGFIADPALLNASYREISSATYVSTGAVGIGLHALEMRGLIGSTASGRRLIHAPGPMLSEWATLYNSTLRPKLKRFRFSTPDPAAMLAQWTPEMSVSAWGGEVAADKITGHLKPSALTIYMDMDDPRHLAECVQRFKLRADPKGTIDVVRAFWNMDRFSDTFPTVPLHLVYADLLATNDSRNLVVAKQIYQQVIEHVHRSQD